MKIYKDLIAVILAGGIGSRSAIFNGKNPKPLTPFFGFCPLDLIVTLLLQCDHIKDISIMLEYMANHMNYYIQDTYRHVNINKPVLPIFSEEGLNGGTLGALANYLKFYRSTIDDEQDILILSGDHIHGLDFTDMILRHRENCSDITIATRQIPSKDAYQFGVLETNNQNEVLSFVEKPQVTPTTPKSTINLGIFIIKAKSLRELLTYNLDLDFSRHAIPKAVSLPSMKVSAFPFEGSWADVGTPLGYYQTIMDNDNILKDVQALVKDGMISKHSDFWPQRTQNTQILGSHTKYHGSSTFQNAIIKDSVIHKGCCVIDSEVQDCVLMPGSIVINGSKLKQTLVGVDSVASGIELNMNTPRTKGKISPLFFDNEGNLFPFINDINIIPAYWNNTKSKYQEIKNKYLAF